MKLELEFYEYTPNEGIEVAYFIGDGETIEETIDEYKFELWLKHQGYFDSWEENPYPDVVIFHRGFKNFEQFWDACNDREKILVEYLEDIELKKDDYIFKTLGEIFNPNKNQ